MKAVLKAVPAPGLELRTVSDPTPAYGEVVLQVKATSMCGTDGHVYQWNNWARQRIRPPRILGHEMYGEVVALGKGVSTVQVGALPDRSPVICWAFFLGGLSFREVFRGLGSS
jgi:threonine 3-dehydrogenase